MKSTRFRILVLLLTLAGAACQTLNPVQSLTTLRERSEDIRTARMLMTMNMKFDLGGAGTTTSPYPTDLTLSTEGVIDFENQRGRALVKLSDYMAKFGAPAGTVHDITVLSQDSFIYYEVPEALTSQFQGKKWVRLDNSALQSQLGTDPTSATSSQPQTFFEFFNEVDEGDIEEIGSEEIRGTGTTHYRVKLTLEDFYASANPEMRKQLLDQATKSGLEMKPSDVWLDSDGFARKVSVIMGSNTERGSFEMTLTMELYDFGTKVEVTIPPESDVFIANDRSALGPLFGTASSSQSSSISAGQPPATGGASGY